MQKCILLGDALPVSELKTNGNSRKRREKKNQGPRSADHKATCNALLSVLLQQRRREAEGGKRGHSLERPKPRRKRTQDEKKKEKEKKRKKFLDGKREGGFFQV